MSNNEIDELKTLYEKLNKEKKAMFIIHSLINSGAWEIDFNEKGKMGKCHWSDEFRQMVGYDKTELTEDIATFDKIVHPDYKAIIVKQFSEVINDYTGKSTYSLEYPILTKNRGWRWVRASGSAIRRPDGTPSTFIGLFTDIDDQKKKDEELAEQFSIVEALSRDYRNVLKIDETGIVTSIKLQGFVPECFKEKLSAGFSYEEFIKKYIEERVYEEDQKLMSEAIAFPVLLNKLEENQDYACTYRALYGGQIHYLKVKFMRLESGIIIAGFILIDDIVLAAKEKENLIVLSETDQMTGLFNRMSGEKRVTESLKNGEGGLFIMLDIDKFKNFNDSFGHSVGDQVIISVALCLKRAFREGDIVFRLGGDEFGAYASHVQDKKTAENIIKRFTDNLEKISIPEIGECPVTASIGAVINVPGESADFSRNYKLADEGVYESKEIQGSAVTYKE